MRKTIQIRKDSWHYRFYSRFYGRWARPGDLCSYARGLLFAVLGYGFLATMILLCSGVLIILIVGSIMEYPAATGIVVGSLVVAAGLIFALIKLGPKINKKFLSEDSLPGAYLKAKKEKYCPLVELVDGEPEKANG